MNPADVVSSQLTEPLFDKGGDPRHLWLPDAELTKSATRLRVLSFNIQAGLHTRHLGDYVSRAWQHLLPSSARHSMLDRVGELISGYDFVAIQEADAGSFRTRFVNQIEYLARRGGFGYHGVSVTRDLRPFAAHCIGFLSRYPPIRFSQYVLPSRIPGRRAMELQLGSAGGNLSLYLTHLSLGARDRRRQLQFLSALLRPGSPAVLLGDLNSEPAFLAKHGNFAASRLLLPSETPPTYPSWRPTRSIDHILVTPEVRVHQLYTPPFVQSDHLPLAAEISLALPS